MDNMDPGRCIPPKKPEDVSSKLSITVPNLRDTPTTSVNNICKGFQGSDMASVFPVNKVNFRAARKSRATFSKNDLRLKKALHRVVTVDLLKHCQLLQFMASISASQPPGKRDLYHEYQCYVKMRDLAIEAQAKASVAQAPGLEVRCDYWAGRGYAGMRLWQAAIEHLSAALSKDEIDKMDVSTDSGRLRGLTKYEKEDCRLLLEIVTQHLERQSHRRNTMAAYESDFIERPVIQCTDTNGSAVRPWNPDLKLLMHLAENNMRCFEDSRNAKAQRDDPNDANETARNYAQSLLDVVKDGDLLKGFTREDLEYIYRGIDHNLETKASFKNRSLNHRKASTSAAPMQTFPTTTTNTSRGPNLEDELAQASSSYTSGSKAPTRDATPEGSPDSLPGLFHSRPRGFSHNRKATPTHLNLTSHSSRYITPPQDSPDNWSSNPGPSSPPETHYSVDERDLPTAVPYEQRTAIPIATIYPYGDPQTAIKVGCGFADEEEEKEHVNFPKSACELKTFLQMASPSLSPKAAKRLSLWASRGKGKRPEWE